MKKLIIKVTLLSAMLVMTAAASVQAQSLAYRARFDIPFDFAFGEKTLPAGQYSIGRALLSSDDVTVAIASRDGRSQALQLSNAAIKLHSDSRAILVFHRYGDDYFLVQVWPAGATSGRQFPETKKERALHKQLAANSTGSKSAANVKRETVVIAAGL